MTTAGSDNEFPKILLVEGAAPAAPATGRVKLYAKADGLLYWKDDAGTEYAVGQGDVSAHLADTSDAHDASAISIVDTGAYFTGTDVEAALQELGAGGGGGGSGNVIAQAAGDVEIPGLAGSGDRVPASPDADDDEFDTTDTSDPMTGWTTLGTPTAHDINSTKRSHYYVKKAAGSISLVGIYKAMSPPFTVTACLSSWIMAEGNARAGVFVAVASPGKIVEIGRGSDDGATLYVDIWSSPTAFSSVHGSTAARSRYRYLRLVAASSTDLSALASQDGVLWEPIGTQNFNPSMTIGAAGLLIDPGASGIATEATFDWIRFS